MLDSKIKNKLKEKLDSLIPEKEESAELKKDLVKKIKKYVESKLTKEEKALIKEHPEVISYMHNFNFYSYVMWYQDKESYEYKYLGDLGGYEVFGRDNDFGYYLDLKNIPRILNFLDFDDPFIREIWEDLRKILICRKNYLLKKRFIFRVLDSRDLTLGTLKKNYPEIYNLL